MGTPLWLFAACRRLLRSWARLSSTVPPTSGSNTSRAAHSAAQKGRQPLRFACFMALPPFCA
ncbi:hypothetical protein C7K05_06860 [Faecalibacterium prausnitzii]|uniref:Uncharacterized protein n=1 Tax=Faecalibacterium prausnitzii TaxID=853 RepID=A0A367G6M5_9FIRM|nr:hypothetical protein C7J97_07660 [Faecalibacterium prausnitzii]RCH50348.1 hypothetical protein C7K05_06860 [Faecalibacterium prausnitzii]